MLSSIQSVATSGRHPLKLMKLVTVLGSCWRQKWHGAGPLQGSLTSGTESVLPHKHSVLLQTKAVRLARRERRAA